MNEERKEAGMGLSHNVTKTEFVKMRIWFIGFFYHKQNLHSPKPTTWLSGILRHVL